MQLTKYIAIFALSVCMIVAIPQAMAMATVPPDAWLMGTKVAIQVFDCNDLLCG